MNKIMEPIALTGVKRNLVQSIRAFSVPKLQDAATRLGHHFLFANLAEAQSKQEIVEAMIDQFYLSTDIVKTFDALSQRLTETLFRAGPQAGFVIVLEHIPVAAKFDREIREQLLDTFRSIADFWGEKEVCCRVFYSFSVARSTKSLPNQSAKSAEFNGEKLPTDKLLDVSPLALRMSSPFNPDYWLTAA